MHPFEAFEKGKYRAVSNSVLTDFSWKRGKEPMFAFRFFIGIWQVWHWPTIFRSVLQEVTKTYPHPHQWVWPVLSNLVSDWNSQAWIKLRVFRIRIRQISNKWHPIDISALQASRWYATGLQDPHRNRFLCTLSWKHLVESKEWHVMRVFLVSPERETDSSWFRR